MSRKLQIATAECKGCGLVIQLWPPNVGKTETGSVYIPAKCPRCYLRDSDTTPRSKSVVWKATDKEPECDYGLFDDRWP